MEIRVLGVIKQSRIYNVFDQDVILVEVVSRTDWVRRAVDGSATVIFDGGFCDGNRNPLLVYPRLFFNGERTDWPVVENQSPNPVTHPYLPTRNEAGMYVVQGYIYVRGEGFKDSSTREVWDEFDLEREPRDICVYVTGGSVWWVNRYESNEVRISEDEIAAALLREL